MSVNVVGRQNFRCSKADRAHVLGAQLEAVLEFGCSQAFGIDISHNAVLEARQATRRFGKRCQIEEISLAETEKLRRFLGEDVDIILCNSACIFYPYPFF